MIFVFPSLASDMCIAAKEDDSNIAHLVLDPLEHTDLLPKNFRKTTDLTSIKENKALNLKGMDKLNISGSEQFSENDLPLLIKAIGTSLPITVVDLRQESHGFINGLAVSWEDSKNNANAGLTRAQVLQDEANKLKSIKLNEPVSFYNKPKIVVITQKIQDENSLVSSKNLSYNRITVRDGGLPSDNMVDYFVEFVKAQPQNSWLHFHCKEGVGRTTTFMIMYDMMKNYKEAAADDIIKRQLVLANLDEEAVKSFNNNERTNFLKRFYDYCKANGDSFNIKWSTWMNKQ